MIILSSDHGGSDYYCGVEEYCQVGDAEPENRKEGNQTGGVLSWPVCFLRSPYERILRESKLSPDLDQSKSPFSKEQVRKMGRAFLVSSCLGGELGFPPSPPRHQDTKD